MKHVEHPKNLYIQLADEGGNDVGLAFCDSEPTDVNSCDFNDFDDETRQRVLSLLRDAYSFVHHRQHKLTQY